MTSTFVLVAAIFCKMHELTNRRFEFILKIFHQFILIPRRIDFLQIGNWSCYREGACRNNFDAYFAKKDTIDFVRERMSEMD